MLHGHVEALFEQRILVLHISTWSHYSCGSSLVLIAVVALIFEPLLASVEYHSILKVLVPGLTVSLRSRSIC